MKPIDYIKDEDLNRIKKWISDGTSWLFYKWYPWRKLSRTILKEDKRECYICKQKHKYSRAVLVHHVNHLRMYPEFAMTKYYIDDAGRKQRQLISVCNDCHVELHEKHKKEIVEPLNEEWW